MKKRKYIIIFSCICAIWAAFIWSNSLQVGDISSEISGSVTDGINNIFGKFIDGFYISGYTVRKIAHFLEFAVLAFLICIDIYVIFDLKRAASPKRAWLLCLAIPCSVAVAAVDEILQIFVDGRVGSFTDVLIDGSGALLATGVFLLAINLKTRKRKDR